MKQTSNPWTRLLMLMLITASAIVLFAVTALANSPSSALASEDSSHAPAVSTPPPSSIYISLVSDGKIKKSYNNGVELPFNREDILRFVPSTSTWEKFLDGSDIGLGGVNLQDFEVLQKTTADPNDAPGDILFAIDRNATLPGIGAVTPRDVIRYRPGVGYSFKLVGSTIDLTKSNENIDAVAITPDGYLVISTFGGATVKDVGKVEDEDLLKIVGTTVSVYFDGTAVGLTSSSEDVGAAWIGNPSPEHNIYLATKGDFTAQSVNSLGGKKSDIFGCSAATTNPINSCFFYSFFEGATFGSNKKIDGISIVPNGPIASVVSAALQDFSAKAVDSDAEANNDIDAATYAEATSQGDSEITAEDFIDVSVRVYLPVVGQ